MPFGITFTQFVFLPSLLLICSSVSLKCFLMLYTFIYEASSGYNKVPKDIRPVFKYLNQMLENCMGIKARDFKYNLTHIVFMAAVLMLVAIYNTLSNANELKKKELEMAKKKKTE